MDKISIEEFNVHMINSIKKKYPALRQASKTFTFALTYEGNWRTLMEQGIIEEQAKHIEKQYHELYKVADKWVAEKVAKATIDGYVTCAFGLRLRTPLLKATVLNTSKTPPEAKSEARSVGNALGQSWGLLNCRAVNEVMQQVWNSPYALKIKPIMQIHDASYYLVKHDLDAICFLNNILVKAMEWQEHPAIAHDKVKLGGDLDIYYPDWAHPITIPHNITPEDLFTFLKEKIHEKH